MKKIMIFICMSFMTHFSVSFTMDYSDSNFFKRKILKIDGAVTKNQKLYNAVIDGDIALTETLLKDFADPNYEREQLFASLTPLFVATLNNDYRMVQLLISYGADVNHIMKKYLITPLYIASDLKIIEELIKNGADINQECSKDVDHTVSILDAAIAQNNTQKIIALLHAGVDLFETDVRLWSTDDDGIADLLLSDNKSISKDDKELIRQAVRYRLYLKPNVARNWNFPKHSLSLRDLIIKQLYEYFLMGQQEGLINLSNDQKSLSMLKHYLSGRFLAKVLEFDNANLIDEQNEIGKLIAKNRIAKVVKNKVAKNRQTKLFDEEASKRDALEIENIEEMQNIAKSAQLSVVRAKQQENFRKMARI